MGDIPVFHHRFTGVSGSEKAGLFVRVQKKKRLEECSPQLATIIGTGKFITKCDIT